MKTHLQIENTNALNNKLLSFSLNKKLLCYYSTFTIYVVNISDNTIINKIPTHEEITIISFDLTSAYIIAGNQNGRVLQYKYNSNLLLSRLCSFSPKNQEISIKYNSVSTLAFYKKKIACGGHRGEIIVMDLYSQSNKKMFTCGNSKVSTLSFLDTDTLIVGSEDGFVHLLYLNKNYSKQINTPFTTIKQLLHVEKTNYIMVHANTTDIALIDIEKCRLSSSDYMSFKINIESIEIISHELLEVCLKDNTYQHVKVSNVDKLKSLIIHNSIYEAYEHINKEPMLIYTKEYKELESKFDDTYLYAIEALVKEDKNLLLQTIDSFISIPSKKGTIRLLIKAYDNYERFKILFVEKNYHIAYAMSLKFPALQKTPEYFKMEEEWKEVLKNAQKQLLLSNRDSAKEMLNKYITINSKREIIKLVLKDNELFIEFLKANEQKNLTRAYEISSINTVFTKLPTYQSLNDEVQRIIQQIRHEIKKGYIDSAKEYLHMLDGIKHLEVELIKLENECKNTLLLQDAYVKKEFKLCYETLDLNPYLKSTDLGLLLENNYSDLMYECEEYALAGNVKDIKITLGELLGLQSRKSKIGDLLRVGFQAKINSLLYEKNFKSAENIIYSYIDIFGMDNELAYVIKIYEQNAPHKLAVSQNQSKRLKRDSWKNSKVIME